MNLDENSKVLPSSTTIDDKEFTPTNSPKIPSFEPIQVEERLKDSQEVDFGISRRIIPDL